VTSQLDSSLWETWRAALDTLTDSWIWMDDARYSRLIMLLRIYSCWPGMLIDIRACLLILIVQTAPHFCFDCLWSKQGQSVNSLAPLLEIVCDVVRWLLSADFPLTISDIRIIQNEVKSLEAARLQVSWLKPIVSQDFWSRRVCPRAFYTEICKIANGVTVIKAATNELEETLMDLAALQKRINATKLVVQKIDDTIKEAEISIEWSLEEGRRRSYVVLLSLWAHIIEENNMGLIFCGLWGPIYIPQLDLPTTQLNWSVGFFYD